MNIDLLITNKGEAGIVTDHAFDSPVAGIMFDAASSTMSLELSDMNAIEMNIPVDFDNAAYLLYAPTLQVGTIEKGTIQDNRQVPLIIMKGMFEEEGIAPMARVSTSVMAFEDFLKRCVSGQPIHRDDLSNEETIDGVMSGINTQVLQFAPHLSRQKTLEAAPTMAPKGPGPAGPSGMGGGGYTGQSTGYTTGGDDKKDTDK